MTDPAQENLNSKKLARNIRHRLADMLGKQWTGALDAAMDEMLLKEIEQFGITQTPTHVAEPATPFEVVTPFCTETGKDIDPEVWAGLNQAELARRQDEDVAVHVEENDDGPAWPLRDRKKT